MPKKIEAIIVPAEFSAVQGALLCLGIQDIVVSEVKRFMNQSGNKEIYRGAEYVVEQLPMTKIELVVRDDIAAKVVQGIRDSIKERHDCLVVITSVEAYSNASDMLTR